MNWRVQFIPSLAHWFIGFWWVPPAVNVSNKLLDVFVAVGPLRWHFYRYP